MGGDLIKRNGEVEIQPSVNDSLELNLLLDILQKNDQGVVHFSATAQEETEDSFPETKVEVEDSEELKLLIQFLNQKHIPLENVAESKEHEAIEMDDRKETSSVNEIENDEIDNANATIAHNANLVDKAETCKSTIEQMKTNNVKKNKVAENA